MSLSQHVIYWLGEKGEPWSEEKQSRHDATCTDAVCLLREKKP